MPIYEFLCTKCDGEFEEMMPINSNGVKPLCPQCGSNEVQKMFSIFGFTSGGSFESSASGSSCSGCSSHNCSNCH